MKFPIFSHRLYRYTALLAASLLMTCPTANAKDKGKSKEHGNSKHDSKTAKKHHHHDHDDDDDDDRSRSRRLYLAAPRSAFYLSLGNGYAGRGYYYGPRNSPYYYERPEVRYYATREAAPREYDADNSQDIAVQRALARAGYYQGPLDGEIGPQSSRAIARYQSAQGLRVTGQINQSLLQSLGL